MFRVGDGVRVFRVGRDGALIRQERWITLASLLSS